MKNTKTRYAQYKTKIFSVGLYAEETNETRKLCTYNNNNTILTCAQKQTSLVASLVYRTAP